MLRRALRLAAATFGLIAAAPAAHAWSEETHQTTGAIAWADLAQRHPDSLARLLTIAAAHQDYRLFAPFAQGLGEPARERALFEWLARWPDDIRGGPEDFPKWHYELRVVSGRTWAWPWTNGTASDGFAYNYAMLANGCAAPADRAKAIGWLLHIVGDIQQPLHGGHQMTEVYNLTDRAGSIAFVRRTAGGEPTDLHQYWDKMLELGAITPPGGGTDWANALLRLWPRQSLPEVSRSGDPGVLFSSYLDESATLAGMVAYQGTFLAASPDPALAPVVSPAENAIAGQLAMRRVATSGYRIADILALALAEADHNQATCES